jgi:hypothetical protein
LITVDPVTSSSCHAFEGTLVVGAITQARSAPKRQVGIRTPDRGKEEIYTTITITCSEEGLGQFPGAFILHDGARAPPAGMSCARRRQSMCSTG